MAGRLLILNLTSGNLMRHWRAWPAPTKNRNTQRLDEDVTARGCLERRALEKEREKRIVFEIVAEDHEPLRINRSPVRRGEPTPLGRGPLDVTNKKRFGRPPNSLADTVVSGLSRSADRRAPLRSCRSLCPESQRYPRDHGHSDPPRYSRLRAPFT